jgi:hypothetical protein
MKIKCLLITVCGICLFLTAAATQPDSININTLEGIWALDSVQFKNENETPKRLENLLQGLYYTCPAKIDIQGRMKGVFHFENQEVKNVFYYVFTAQNRKLIQFSVQGKGSLPEGKYIYFIERDNNHLILIYSESSVQYIYHYSLFNNQVIP